jgi:hypothetical protein
MTTSGITSYHTGAAILCQSTWRTPANGCELSGAAQLHRT